MCEMNFLVFFGALFYLYSMLFLNIILPLTINMKNKCWVLKVGILCNLIEQHEINYVWGLRKESNNMGEMYKLLLGLQISKGKVITRIIIVGDSLNAIHFL